MGIGYRVDGNCWRKARDAAPSSSRDSRMWLLERPLHGQRGIEEERLVVVGVVDEVAADFPLCSDAQIHTIHTLQGVQVVP